MTTMVSDRDIIEASEIRLAELRLAEFQRQAWPLVESVPFSHNWHIDCICEHLQAVVDGQIKQLLINVPPGTSKSLNTCVFFPAWAWAQKPELRFLFASYDDTLSTRDSVKCRTILESSWYRRRWGHMVQLRRDENQKTKYQTTRGGYRLSTMVAGHATGEHPDIIGIDDPHNVAMAESQKARQTAIEWWDLTMSTRGVARDVRKVISMQRLHVKDLSGHVMEDGDWVVLCLPMRYEPNRMVTTCLGWNDPRNVEGELLWPSVFTEEKVKKLERDLGPYGTAGQLQQRPSPRGGGTFQRDLIEVVDAAPAVPRRIVRSWDVASTAGGGDATASVRMSEVAGTYYIEHVSNDRLDVGPRDEKIAAITRQDGHSVTCTLPQDPAAAGKAQGVYWVRMLRGYDVRLISVTGDKQKRAAGFASMVSTGSVKIVRGEWNQTFLDQLEVFPRGEFDDMVDAGSDAFNMLTGMMDFIVDPSWIRKFETAGTIVKWLEGGAQKSVEQGSLTRFAIICSDSLVGKAHSIASSNWSGVQVWDLDRSTGTMFIRYVWAGRVNWPELKDKITEIANAVTVNTWCVVYNPSSEQVYSAMRSGEIAGVSQAEFIHEKDVLKNHTSFVDCLVNGRLYLNANRHEDCDHIERDWCVANRTETAAPIHLKLSVHGVDFAKEYGDSWGGLARPAGVFSVWSKSSIVN